MPWPFAGPGPGYTSIVRWGACRVWVPNNCVFFSAASGSLLVDRLLLQWVGSVRFVDYCRALVCNIYRSIDICQGFWRTLSASVGGCCMGSLVGVPVGGCSMYTRCSAPRTYRERRRVTRPPAPGLQGRMVKGLGRLWELPRGLAVRPRTSVAPCGAPRPGLTRAPRCLAMLFRTSRLSSRTACR